MAAVKIPLRSNYIKSLYKNKCQQMKNITVGYYQNSTQGWANGRRLARMKNFNPIQTLAAKISGSAKKVSKHSKADDMPYVLGGIGTAIPIPFFGPGGIVVGMLIKYGNKILKSMKNVK